MIFGTQSLSFQREKDRRFRGSEFLIGNFFQISENELSVPEDGGCELRTGVSLWRERKSWVIPDLSEIT